MKRILLLLFVNLALSLNAQTQISENFEGSFPPEDWYTFSVPGDDPDGEFIHQPDFEVAYGTIGHAHTGDFGVLSSFWEDESWLITPQFTPTEAFPNLFLHHRQKYTDEYGDTFLIKVSTEENQDNPDDFTTIMTLTEEDLNTNSYAPLVIDLSAYINNAIYVAFVHIIDEGEEWYIDDVLTAPIELPGASTNPSPNDGATDIMITNSQTSHIPFSWEAPTSGGTVDQYDFLVGTSSDNLSLLGYPEDFTANPAIFHFNTTYYWKAAALNMMGETSPTWSFTTVNQPTIMAPYVIDFENEGFVPDACDQAVTNEKWWEYTDTPTGHIGNNGDFEGTTTESGGFFAFIDDSTSPNAMNTTFTTPFIEFVDIVSPAVSFYINSNNEGGANVNFTVKKRALGIEDSCITIFTSNTNTAGWEKVVVELEPDDCGGIFQLLFIIDEIEDSANDDFAIDDISFYDFDSLSVNTQTIFDLSTYPNPVKDILNIHADETINQIVIYNLIGKIVKQTLVDANDITLDISELSVGNYFVKIISEHQQKTIKIVKE